MFDLFNKKLPKSSEKKALNLLKVISVLNTGLDLDKMLGNVSDKITEELGYNAAAVFLIEGKRLRSLKVSSFPLVQVAVNLIPQKLTQLTIGLEETENLIVKSIAEKRIIVGNDEADFIYPVVSRDLAHQMQGILRIKQLAAFPLMNKDVPIGAMMVSTVRENEINQDLELLEVLMSTLGIAVNNAYLFTQTQNQLIELADKNKNLEAINSFTNLAITSLEPDKVVSEAINSIPDLFDVLGAIYSTYNEEKKNLRLAYFSNNDIANAAFKMIGLDPKSLTLDLENPIAAQNITYKAYRTGKVQVSPDLKSLTIGVLDEGVLTRLQKFLGVTCIVSAPVISHNSVIGTLNFIMKDKSPEDLSEEDLNVFTFVAYQLGITLENATLYKRVEQALVNVRKSRAELQEKYQFEKDMMGIMGHELRTPMTVAKGMAELVISKATKGAEIEEQYLLDKLEKIHMSIIKESNLIQTMLSTSHIDNTKINLQYVKFDLIDLINYTVLVFKKDAEMKGLTLEFFKPNENKLIIESDQNRVQEIVTNLVSNAVKYTNKGSVKIYLEHDDKNAVVKVVDTGIGIPKDEIQNIGKKFYRVNQHLDDKKDVVRAGGTGLGLYVVKGLLDAMGGELKIDSEVQKGSTFTAVIPMNDQATDNSFVTTAPVDTSDLFEKFGFKYNQGKENLQG